METPGDMKMLKHHTTTEMLFYHGNTKLPWNHHGNMTHAQMLGLSNIISIVIKLQASFDASPPVASMTCHDRGNFATTLYGVYIPHSREFCGVLFHEFREMEPLAMFYLMKIS